MTPRFPSRVAFQNSSSYRRSYWRQKRLFLLPPNLSKILLCELLPRVLDAWLQMMVRPPLFITGKSLDMSNRVYQVWCYSAVSHGPRRTPIGLYQMPRAWIRTHVRTFRQWCLMGCDICVDRSKRLSLLLSHGHIEFDLLIYIFEEDKEYYYQGPSGKVE